MRGLLIVAAAAALTGCLHVVPASTALTATRGFVAAEASFDGAIQLADQAVLSGKLPVATVAQIKNDADTGYKAVIAGRAAVKAANATDIVTATASLTALVSDLSALSPKKGS
jgi:hypothetical protein